MHKSVCFSLSAAIKSFKQATRLHVQLTIAAVKAAFSENGLPQPEGPTLVAVDQLRKQTAADFGQTYWTYGHDPTAVLEEWSKHIDLAVDLVVHAFAKDSAAIKNDVDRLMDNINGIVALQVQMNDGVQSARMQETFRAHITTTGAYILHAANEGITDAEWTRLINAAIKVGVEMGQVLDELWK